MADPGFPREWRQPLSLDQKPIITARKQSLGQGNVFTGVCLFTWRGWLPSMHNRSHDHGEERLCIQRGEGESAPQVRGAVSRGSASRVDWANPPPPEIHVILRDTDNKWVVCILLQCILVWQDFCQKLHENERN